MINKTRLIKLTQKLISIDSQNPPGRESEIARFVGRYLSDLGLKIKTYEFKKGRTNLIAYLNTKKSSKSLLVTPHLDTVPIGKNWTVDSFKGKIVGDKLYGLGATDCKCNVAVSMEVINSIVEDCKKLDYNLIFAATADEECGSDLGLIPLLNKNILKPTEAVVLDADDFGVIVAQKGLMHLKVIIKGVRAHGAYTWRGDNAIDRAVAILKELKSKKFKFKLNKHLHSPTINIGTIKGGDKVNIVADWCEFELDFRFLPGTSSEYLLKELNSIIKKHAKNFKIEIQSIQQPYLIDESHPLVSGLRKAFKSQDIKYKVRGSEGATVITFFQHKNIPAVATGFGSDGCAHTNNEFVSINNIYKGAKALEKFLVDYKLY